jgi:hypothetical protein
MRGQECVEPARLRSQDQFDGQIAWVFAPQSAARAAPGTSVHSRCLRPQIRHTRRFVGRLLTAQILPIASIAAKYPRSMRCPAYAA